MVLTCNIDLEVNAYFQQIFNTAPGDHVLNIFRRFHASPLQRHKEMVRCMLKHLIAEYQLFPIYPEKLLFKMANFVGGFLEHGLISDENTLNTIIGYIFYDLKNNIYSNAYKFSYIALDRCKMRLKDFPKLCLKLRKIENFEYFSSELVECIEYGMDGLEPPSRRVTEEGTLSSTVDNGVEETNSCPLQGLTDCVQRPTPIEPPAITTAAATNVQIIEPSKYAQGKINFILNNLSTDNVQTKCREIKSLITKKHLPWFSTYVFTERAQNELNNHELYSKVLDCLNSELLDCLIIADTLRKIKMLLRRNEGSPSQSGKQPIKNLGHWLGAITLAKNKPIPKEDIDLEHLLADVYEKSDGELLFVVQFVTKTLQSCSVGQFGLNNPWTISVINRLFEIYEKPGSKMQVQIEIEIMCKALNINLEIDQ